MPAQHIDHGIDELCGKGINGSKTRYSIGWCNRSQMVLYKYNERLLAVTNYPKIIIPTIWANFLLPYGFSQQSGAELKLIPFQEDVKRLSPNTKVIIPEHLGTIVID